jgi:P4 family phage/plasmid primase-like protien
VDFEKKEFRPGRPEDFCSLCTRSEYVELDDHDPEQLKIRAEVETFLAQLFPDPELREYMIESLAAVLRGDNKNQTFNILTGSGRNGKSKLIDLMGLVLGDYKGTVPLTLITNKRGSIGSVSPEVAGLKGLRYAVMQEPSKGMQINEGVMKELTGGDPISGRKLFHDTITFKPQFSLAVCTNHLFDIKSTDDGTWRRIRVCPFVSKFVPKPYKDPLIDCEHQFLCDKDIDKNFTRWAPILTAMLVKKAFETDGEVTDCECVIASSQQYKQKQDHFMTFFNERIVEDSNGVVKRLNALHEFQDWYGELYGSRCPQGRELYDYLTKRMGAIDRNKRPMGWYGYRLERSYQDQLDVEPDDI